MSMRKSIFMMISFLLVLSSCGKDDKKSGRRVETNPICEDVSCLSTVNWRVQLPGRVFPDKVRVDINGTTVLNECVSKQKYFIERNAIPQTLYLEDYQIPKRGDLKIHVRDLGNCDSFSMFIENNMVDFEFLKMGMEREILISL